MSCSPGSSSLSSMNMGMMSQTILPSAQNDVVHVVEDEYYDQ